MQPEPQHPYHPEPPDDATIWRCPNCGQHYFGDTPPDLCAVCQDFTTWRQVSRADLPPDDDLAPENKR